MSQAERLCACYGLNHSSVSSLVVRSTSVLFSSLVVRFGTCLLAAHCGFYHSL